MNSVNFLFFQKNILTPIRLFGKVADNTLYFISDKRGLRK